MIDTLLALLGSYTPQTTTVQEVLSDGSTVSYTALVPGLAGADWPWITSAAILLVCVFWLFRFIYGVFLGGHK